jgi:hypothetical protein
LSHFHKKTSIKVLLLVVFVKKDQTSMNWRMVAFDDDLADGCVVTAVDK